MTTFTLCFFPAYHSWCSPCHTHSTYVHLCSQLIWIGNSYDWLCIWWFSPIRLIVYPCFTHCSAHSTYHHSTTHNDHIFCKHTISLAYATPMDPLTTLLVFAHKFEGVWTQHQCFLPHLQASWLTQLFVGHFYHRRCCVLSCSHYQHSHCQIHIFTGQLAPGEPQPFCMLVKPCIHPGQHSTLPQGLPDGLILSNTNLIHHCICIQSCSRPTWMMIHPSGGVHVEAKKRRYIIVRS